MAKIAYLGAGSLGFGPKLIGDMLSYESLQDSDLCLVDPDADRLATVEGLAHRLIADASLPTRVRAVTDLGEALDGADYVIASIRCGLEAEALDIQIPLEVGGLRQSVADTVGVGGVMKALRTTPPLLKVGREMQRRCPQALFLNYTNPMAIIMWAWAETCRVPAVGLCHSVQYSSEQLASYIGVPREGLRFKVGGINHMAWFVDLRHDGEDLRPRLKGCLDQPEIVAKDPVRFDILRHFGYFVTESSRHMSEYVPYYLHREEEIARLECGWRDEASLATWHEHRVKMDADQRARIAQPATIRRSNEYGAAILNAVETDTPTVIHGNVPNHGLIPNLLAGSCVEVACLVDGQGLRPTYFGPLPAQCAGLCSSNIAMQGLVVQALLEHDREAAIQAAMLDPNTAAQMTLPQIREAMNRLLDAQRDELDW